VEQIVIGNLLDEATSQFRPGRILLEGTHIAALEWGHFGPGEGSLYRPESFIAPGFIELQINGGLGYDFTTQPEAVFDVAAILPRWGVTSFLPTIITSPATTYLHALAVIGAAMGRTEGTQILGVHLEGPFLNPHYRGVHNPAWLQLPALEKVKAILDAGPLRLFTIAPELQDATKVINFLQQQGVLVSMGHSAATYEQTLTGHKAGALYATHLFNAMLPLHQREPGLAGAVLTLPEVKAGIIVDGIHLHPAVVKLAYQSKGAVGLNLVTDAMAGMGMPPGRYELSGQGVKVDKESARLDNSVGTLAGSILTLDRAIRNMQKWSGCSLAEAIQMVTRNPAQLLNLERKGRLVPHYDADLVVLDREGEVEMTFVKGQQVFPNLRQLA